MYIFTEKGKVPPAAAFAAATTNHREAYGVAVAFDNAIQVQSGVLDWSDEAATQASLNMLTAYAESWKDGVCCFWFSDSVVKTDQPFTLFEIPNEDGKTTTIHTVTLFDGDYEKHDDSDSSESPEFLCFEKLVQPRASEIAAKVEGDITKFQEYLDLEKNKANVDAFLEGVMSDDSEICFLISTGLILNFEQGESVGKQYSWGFMSNPCGYTETQAKPGLIPKGAKGTLVPKSVTTADIDKAVGKIVLINMHPPKAIKSSKDLIKWYQTWNYKKDSKGVGIVPENSNKRPPVEIDKAKWEADPNFRDVAKPATATSVPVTAGLAPKAALAGKKPGPAQGVHTIKFNPILTAQEKAQLTAGWMTQGFINDASTSTSTLGSLETKVPTFAETTGVSLNDLLRHSPDSFEYMAINHPKLSANLNCELLTILETKGVLAPAKSPANASKGLLQLKPKAA